MKRVNAGLLPTDLNLLQKRRVEVSKEMTNNICKDTTFIKRIIIGD